jgi:DNA-binding PadR family transcriptional regulator
MTARKENNMTAVTASARGCEREDVRRVWAFMTSGGRRRRHGHPRHLAWGGPGAAFGGPFFRSGRRARRGDVRAAILVLLAEEPMNGYQLMAEIAERSDGVWRPSPGSVYPTLQQLEDEGLVRAEATEAGKRVFALTDEGKAETERLGSRAPWELAADEAGDETVALRDVVFQVLAAAHQVAQAGTSEQVTAAGDVMRDTRRKLYQLLAEDSADKSDAS